LSEFKLSEEDIELLKSLFSKLYESINCGYIDDFKIDESEEDFIVYFIEKLKEATND